MYPTVVIVLVETQRSMTDICEISSLSATKLADPMASEARYATLGRLSLADGPVQSITGAKAEFWPSSTFRSQDGQGHDLEEVIVEVKDAERKVGSS